MKIYLMYRTNRCQKINSILTIDQNILRTAIQSYYDCDDEVSKAIDAMEKHIDSRANKTALDDRRYPVMLHTINLAETW